MIITRSWLSDWLDIENKNLSELVNTLNSIGIEVANAYRLRVSDKIVVGFVKEKVKHENSDKLSICQVDVGNEILQIVCGASNVVQGQFVAVALIGAIMPNGMTINKTKLRGADSYGMLCSSVELGFAKINDGILILDESIGKLELGRALNEYSVFNDDLIEVELTPNRGDCLSVYGIARDLATAWDLNLKKLPVFKEEENVLGIGRILRLQAEKNLNSLFNYRAIEIKENIKLGLLYGLRLAQIGALKTNTIENFLFYTTYSTGVLFNAYNFNELSKENEDLTFNLSKEANGTTKVSCNNQILGISGIYQEKKLKCDVETKIIIIEANYTDPFTIANAKNIYKEQDNDIFYRSFRGSEPKLNLGMDFLLKIFKTIPNIIIYSSSQQISEEKEIPSISLNIETINNIIGQVVDKDEILKILKKLGFEIIFFAEGLVNVKPPIHRPDIKNLADICEEVVRIIGIDNIKSKNLNFVEKNRLNLVYKDYKKLLDFRLKAVNNGYFESLHFILDNEEELKDFNFKPIQLTLVNPINQELNTLRTTLLNHLINAASLNIKNSKKLVKLFESGVVFDQNNQELNHMAFIHSGYKEESKISNKAKPNLVNFYDFLLDIKNIIGEFKLIASNYTFLSPYEQADLYVDGIKIGFIGRLHLKLENARSLLKTYVCEFDLDTINLKDKKAKIYSKFPSIHRDLSILIPKNFSYDKIKTYIENFHFDILENFRIVDLYTDETLQDKYSLTISFTFRDQEKTLEDSEVVSCMDKILEGLKDLGLNLR